MAMVHSWSSLGPYSIATDILHYSMVIIGT
jgi:hypothetical protein